MTRGNLSEMLGIKNHIRGAKPLDLDNSSSGEVLLEYLRTMNRGG